MQKIILSTLDSDTARPSTPHKYIDCGRVALQTGDREGLGKKVRLKQKCVSEFSLAAHGRTTP